QPASPGKFCFYVSDLTHDSAGDYTGPGADSRFEAAIEALRGYMEQHSPYPRGTLSVFIPALGHALGGAGQRATLRVAAGPLKLVMEGIEGATLVASIALVAAAPFTGGASLALLVPVGV